MLNLVSPSIIELYGTIKMKTRDALKISTRTIRAHLKRNLITIAVMGMIFGLIFIVQLGLTGLQNSYTKRASDSTNGQVIFTAANNAEGMIINDTKPQLSRDNMVKDIEAHGGKVLGDAKKFGMFRSIILPVEFVQGMIEADLNKAPADAAPILVTAFVGEQLLDKDFPTKYTSATSKQKDYESYRRELIGKTFIDSYGAKYYVAGLASDNFHVNNLSFEQLENKNSNLLNPLLEIIPTPEGRPIVIDNGKSQLWQGGTTTPETFPAPPDEPAEDLTAYDQAILKEISDTSGDTVIAVFDNNEQAYEYLKHSKGSFTNIGLPGREYFINVVAGMSPEVTYIFNVINTIVSIASVILGIIATIVVIFTSIRLIDQDQQNIALYYSLGATSGQVRTIYLCYFLELIIGSFLFAFTLASAIVLLFNVIDQNLLGIQAMLGFNQAAYESVWWYGVNHTTLLIFGIMLMMAPLCILVNRKKLLS